VVVRAAAAILLLVAGCEGDKGEPRRLSEAGLYADLGARRIAPDLLELSPRHELWSDGAAKRRWLRLPAGALIDTSDPDHWRFPVGTQLWKEFAVGGVPVETRLIERVSATGDDRADFWMGSFVWLPDGSDAIFAEAGVPDINGTLHDAPPAFQCWTCHLGEPGHVLGISAVQLGEAGRARLASRLTDPAPPPPPAVVDDPALGTLHANCGHCHNPAGTAWSFTALDLRLRAGDGALHETAAYRTAVGQPLDHFLFAGFTTRVAPGDPGRSALLHRMESRTQTVAMPPLATERVDDAGAAAVRRWIEGLPAPP
jgi:hypothetical protein